MSGSFFDDIQKTAFDVTRAVFGFSASWDPSDGSPSFTGMVNLQNPSELAQLSGVFYDPSSWEMEYYEGDFKGLFEIVRSKASIETITVNDQLFQVKSISKIHDGKTFKAELQPLIDT